MNPVRCRHCGRGNLPAMPGSIGGAGRLAYPVAHVRETLYPCMQGLTREVLSTCIYPGILAAEIEQEKARIWTDETLWEL
jgi:hypothetical protein